MSEERIERFDHRQRPFIGGEWVRYEDHLAAVKRLEGERDELEKSRDFNRWLMEKIADERDTLQAHIEGVVGELERLMFEKDDWGDYEQGLLKAAVLLKQTDQSSEEDE